MGEERVTRKRGTGKRGGEGEAVNGKGGGGGHLNSQIPEALVLPRCWVSCLREVEVQRVYN
jgi:hypothetical protein